VTQTLGRSGTTGRRAACDRGSEAIREPADFRCWPVLIQTVKKGGGEGVACAYGIDNVDWNAADLCIFGAFQNGAAMLAAGDANGVPLEARRVIAAERFDRRVGGAAICCTRTNSSSLSLTTSARWSSSITKGTV